MQTKAFVLVTIEVGKAEEVVQALKNVSGITAAHLVTGPHDAVATVAGADTNAIGKIILNQMHGILGVKGTLTLMGLQPAIPPKSPPGAPQIRCSAPRKFLVLQQAVCVSVTQRTKQPLCGIRLDECSRRK